VGLCQLLMQIFGSFVEEETVKQTQLLLSDFNEKLKDYLGFYPIFAAVIIVVTLSFLLKRSSLLNQFLTFKTLAGRFLVALTIITSFSFFSASAISSYEPEWKAMLSQIINYRFSEIQKQENKLLAEAIIKDELLTPNTAKNTRVVRIFRSAATHENANQIIVRVAKESIKPKIAKINQIPNMSFAEKTRYDELIERFNNTKESEFQLLSGVRLTLSLHELKELDVACEERAKIVEASAEAGLEVIKAGLTSFLPEGAHFMVSPFLETLVEGLAENVLSPLQKHSIITFEDAMKFARSKIFKRNVNSTADIIVFSDDIKYEDHSTDAMVTRIHSEIQAHNLEEQQRREEYIKYKKEAFTNDHRYEPRYKPPYRPHFTPRR
jgi:hypothetical protein